MSLWRASGRGWTMLSRVSPGTVVGNDALLDRVLELPAVGAAGLSFMRDTRML